MDIEKYPDYGKVINHSKLTIMNTINISELQQETQRIRECIEHYNATHEPSQFRVFPRVMEAIAEHGAENIFLVGERYRGGYHDDYASFTYFNNVTGEEFNDEWTTAFACPAYDCYKCLTLQDAFAAGLVNLEMFLKMKREDILNHLESASPTYMDAAQLEKYKLLVTVNRGRKWKGTGYVVGSRTMRFGWKEVTYANIFDPVANVINEISMENVENTELVPLFNEWKAQMVEKANNATVSCLLVSEDGNVNYPDLHIPFKAWLCIRANEIKVDTSTASWPAQEARDKKKADFKVKKLAELVEWVKSNTDKQGDDIQLLAERIFARRYA